MRGIALLLIVVCSGAFAQSQETAASSPETRIVNYKLADHDGSAAPGAAVAVSPRNNKNIVAYAAGKLMYSNDAGVTWKQSTSVLSGGSNGTPSIASDPKGNFYLVYTNASLSQVLASSSSDDGKTWSQPVVVSDVPGKDKFDARISAHPRREEFIVTWSQADKLGMKDDSCKTDIVMSASGGKKWSKPVQINQNSGNCLDGDFTVRGSMPCIAFDGKIFIVWATQGAIVYDRSYDGSMWISTDLSITDQADGWRLEVPGLGEIANTPVLAIDNSPSRIHGTMFMVFSDTKSGERDTDVWMMRSSNRGDNWTSAARINQDGPGREQFLPRMSIDLANGFVYILYYDRRDYTDNQTDVYLAWSVDGGNQFKERKISEKPFTPAIDGKGNMTDYIGLSAQKGLIIPVWTAINGSKQEVWTAVIKETDLNK
jgi:hypothetical protein